MSWRLATTLIATAVLAVSCHAALSLDDLELVDGVGGGGAGTTSTSSSSSSSGTGGTGGSGGQGGTGGDACDPDLCPGSDTDCTHRICNDMDECDVEFAEVGTACTGPNDEHVCNEDGTCVECNVTDDCDGTDVCDNENCVLATCTDQQQNGDETDVDCGGIDCSPCENTLSCLAPTDCVSGFCNNLTCAPCTTENDCQTAEYCDGGVCQPQKADGTTCAANIECVNGNCPADDSVCCDSVCDGTCEACQNAKTGAADGKCAPTTAGQDYEGECTDQGAPSCGPNGTGCEGNTARCIVYDNSTLCAAPVCNGATLQPAAFCDGNGTCTSGSPVACDPYQCDQNGTDCRGDCLVPADCTSGYTCIIGTNATGYCGSPLAIGGSCAFDNECASTFCRDEKCCDGPCNLLCEACASWKTGATDGTCAPVAAGQDFDNECTQDDANCVADTCGGVPGQCGVASASVMCRLAPLPCDVPELCDGNNHGCPGDLVAPANTACRPPAGSCDIEEVCDGNAKTCPTDVVEANGVECRPAQHTICDFSEQCDGSSPACPGDQVAAQGTSCDDGSFCTGVETCDGNGACISSGNPCPGPDGDGDCAESCNPVIKNCTAYDSPGAPCDNNNSTCHLGVCCGFSPPPPGGNCPSECTGGCANNICKILCQTSASCSNTTVQCPLNYDCRVECTGPGSCKDSTIACPPSYACSVECANSDACAGTHVACSGTGFCDMHCTAASNSCGNATMACGANKCSATCDQPGNAPSLDCSLPPCSCSPC